MIFMRKQCSEKEQVEFAQLLVRLSPIEFLGACRFLNIQLVRADDAADDQRDFYTLYCEAIDEYARLNRTQRRNLLKILRPAAKAKEGDVNADDDDSSKTN